MADTFVKVLTPASSFDLLSLDEVKIALGIDPSDTTQDARLQQWITRSSGQIATLCNRVFAYEEVQESWTGLGVDCNRVYLSHWPIVEADIKSVSISPSYTILDPTGWELEESSGKVELLSDQSEPIVVTYSGGYTLPDGPGASAIEQAALQSLKQACQIFIMEQRALAMLMQTAGVRSIRHKEASVQFIDPMQFFGRQALLMGGAEGVARSILMNYIRIWV
jgi:hypothetical protein